MPVGGKGTLNAHNGHRHMVKKSHYERNFTRVWRNKEKRVLQSSGEAERVRWVTTHPLRDTMR